MIAAPGQELTLWFVNGSGRSGKACVYQAAANVKLNLGAASALAWMLAPANPTVWIQFVWQIAYDFAWFDAGPPRSQQLLPTAVGAAVTLSRNAYGYTLSPVTQDGSSSLTIHEDGSIPSVNGALAGIGMDGAGTFACPAAPNQTLVFTPASKLAYAITFGDYTFAVNDVLPLAGLNPSGAVSFPSGVFTMTAALDASNAWSVTPGSPEDSAAVVATPGIQKIRYEPRRGVLG